MILNSAAKTSEKKIKNTILKCTFKIAVKIFNDAPTFKQRNNYTGYILAVDYMKMLYITNIQIFKEILKLFYL